MLPLAARLLVTLGALLAADMEPDRRGPRASVQALPERHHPAALDTLRLRHALDTLRRTTAGRLGIGIELLETRQRVMLAPSGRFPMQSVYKLPIALATLAAVDRGALRLDQRVDVGPADYVGNGQRSPLRDAHPAGTTVTVEQLLALSTAESDGSACDVLFRLLGGPAAVQRHLDGAGIRGIRVRSTEKALGASLREQYDNWATPAGALTLLRALHAGRLLADTSQARLQRLLVETPTGPRRLKGRLPAGTIVAHKTGTSGTVRGITAATNDIGIITLPDGRHLAVAVFLTDSPMDEAAREGVIAAVARAAWDAALDTPRP